VGRISPKAGRRVHEPEVDTAQEFGSNSWAAIQFARPEESTVMSEAKSKSAKVSVEATPASSLAQLLDAHARMEMRCGEIYVQFATAFRETAELKRMWATMALEEGGHSAMVRAVNRGLLSGMLSAKSPMLPVEYLDSLTSQLAEYQRRAEEGVPLDTALRITWELECSELEFMRELLVSSSNLAELGFSTADEDKDEHVARLRRMIQKYTTDEGLRREVMFLSSELLRPFPTGQGH
jgi:rubrerythrin